MALESATVSVSLGQGLDSKTDPKVTAKPTLIQDGIFTNPHRVSKRNGYDPMTLNIVGGGSISSPVMVKSYRNELVCAGKNGTDQRLFSYSSTLNGWVDCGKYYSIKTSKQVVSSPELWASGSATYGVINGSAAYLSGVSAYSYDGIVGAGGGTYYSLIDSTTGARIADGTLSSSGNIQSYSRMVALGTSRFAVFYVSNISGTLKLCYQTITVSGLSVTLGSEVTLNTITTGNSANDYVYDVITTTSGCFVALGNGSAVVLYTINTSGVSTHGPTTIVTSGPVGSITTQVDTAGTNVWIYWLENLTTIKYAVYNSSTLSSVLSATSVATGLSNIRQLSSLATSTTTQNIYWSELTTPGSSGVPSFTNGVFYPVVHINTVNQAGTVGSPSIFLSGVEIYSKPFSVGSRNFMGLVTLSQSNPVGLVIDLSDKVCVSKFLPGSAEGIYLEGYNQANATYTAPSIGPYLRHPGFVVNPQYLSSTQVILSCGFVVTLSTNVPLATGNLAAYPSIVTVSALTGVCSITLDFNHKDSYQSLIQQDTLVLNGGVVSQYDGDYSSELGFTVDPDQLTVQAAATGGVLVTGKYVYFVVYEWVDGRGNLHQSAPSIGVVVNFTSGTSNEVTLTYANPTITQKRNVLVKIYRTTANGTIPYFLVALPSSLFGLGIGAGAAYVDTSVTDAAIVNNGALYTEGGAILDNIAPPPSMILWTKDNRIWCVDSENPENTLEYSKTASPGTGISFSTGFLEYLIDSKNGEVTGASPMDEKTVILKENGIGYFIGDGANDAGSGSQLTAFQFIPSDTGCSSSRSVVLYPDGILFRASNNKGIYKLNRGTQVGYFALDVEAYNSQDITSSFIVPNKNQIRFLTSSGSSILYDYIMQQWSVFTNHQGLSADQYSGLYVYAKTDGNIFLEIGRAHV